MGREPIIGEGKSGKDVSLQSAAEHAVKLLDGLGVHLHNRAETQAQLDAELERETPNGLYCALKELEIAVHSAAMSQGVGQLALLAALGVIVRPPGMTEDGESGTVLQ
jgi:hypothetical protein